MKSTTSNTPSVEEQELFAQSMAIINAEPKTEPSFPGSHYWSNFSLRVREKISTQEEKVTSVSKKRFWKLLIPQLVGGLALLFFALRLGVPSEPGSPVSTPVVQQIPLQKEEPVSFSNEVLLDEVADIAAENIQSVKDINDIRLAQIIENLTPQQLDDIIALEEQTKGM